MMTISVYGPGCPNCATLEARTRRAAAAVRAEATIVKVTDYAEIAKAGVLTTPGLALDGRVVCAGRVPSESEIETWIAEAAARG